MAMSKSFFVSMLFFFTQSVFQNSKFNHAPGKNLPIALSLWLIEFKPQNYCITYDLYKLLNIKENPDT